MNFCEFNKKIIDKYAGMRRDFPYAAEALDYYIRLLEAGRFDYLKNNRRHLMKVAIPVFFMRIFFFARFALNNVFKAGVRDHYYIECSKFPHFENEVKREHESNSERFYEFKWRFFRSAVLLGLFSRLLIFISIGSLVKGGKIPVFTLSLLDFFIKKNIEESAFFVVQNRIKKIYLLGDKSAQAKVFIMGARKNGVSVEVMAHGYIQDKLFISVLPLFASRILLWDSYQRDFLINEGRVKKSRVKVWGYPKYDLAFIKEKAMKLRFLDNTPPVATFVCTYIPRSKSLDVIFASCKSLRKLGYDVYLRLHPKNRNDKAIVKKIKRQYIKIDNSDVSGFLVRNSVVVGHSSSLLYESSLVGIPTYMLIGEIDFFFPGIDTITPKELESKLVNLK